MSDYETVKERASLREYAAAHLKAGREKDTYVCPICGSGTGKNKSAAFTIMPNGRRFHCFSCETIGDVFDLAGYVHGIEDRAEQLREVAAWAHITLDDAPRGFKETMNARKQAERATEAPEADEATEAPENDYTEGRERHRRYIAECARRMADEPTDEVISYLSARGITHDEAVTLGIGYDPSPQGWKDEAGNWHNTPRIVLPWLGCDYYHIDRACDDRAIEAKYVKPKTDEVGAQPLYNPEAFTHDCVVVVEGVLDAIAVQLCGFNNAVALGGTAFNDFANEAAARNYSGVVIEMLDADGESGADGAKGTKGRRAGADLVTLLAEAGITTLARAEYGIGEADNYAGHKDAGEWFADNRDDLADMLEAMEGAARDKARTARDAEYREAMKNLNVKDPARVARDVYELRNVYEPVSTGIASLDGVLGGGVSLGETTFFGAVSSYGKTTLAVQVADYMASRGRPVLFVTIEQSAKELVSKSLSRLMYLAGSDYDSDHITSPSEITSLRERNAWGAFRRESLERAVDRYSKTIAPHMRILEGSKQPTVSDVRAVAERMKEHDGRAPIVFIDYLQLLAPLSVRYDTDKRNADANVSELRKMARDLVTHVFCISSLNRSSYSGVISLDSFKESGGIEYGADNLLGLQPRNMAEKLEDVSEAKVKRAAEKLIRDNKKKLERDCELVILKQRNGAVPDDPIPLVFNTKASYIYEAEPAKAGSKPRAGTVL